MLNTIRKSPTVIAKLQNRLIFPEKLKGTVIEKWAMFWKNLFIDYKQMLQDLRTDIQDEPRKALLWCSGITSAYILAKNNPSEIDFRHQFKQVTNEAILVSEECRNSESIEHLRLIQQCYNEGVIHYMSLGVISFMYTTEVNGECDLYKAHCSYLKPTYSNVLSKIIDIGVMGRWWNLHIKTTNFDVNV